MRKNLSRSLAVLLPFLFIGNASAGYVDLVLNDPGLVSYWRFEEEITPGGTAVDSNGNANPGFYPDDGGVTASNDSVIVGGQSAEFDGEPFQVIEIENEENFDFEDTMTVEAWIKTDGFDKSWQAIINKGDDQWRLHRRGDSNGLAFGRDEDGTNNKDTIDSGVDVDDGEWHHVVGVFDNADTLTASLYLDGELIADGPDAETIGPLNTDVGGNVDLPVMIGGNAQDGNHYRSWTGWIDEVAVYNRAFTEADVLEHFMAEKTDAAGVPGDYNGSGDLDIGDLDLMIADINAGTNTATFDLTGDGLVDGSDLGAWVTGLRNTWIGDANLDGEFNSSDFVQVFGVGKFETGQPATYGEGDWNGDGVFSSGDFVAAFTDGGFELGPRPAGAQVPEPSSIALILLGVCGLVSRARRSENVATV